MIIYINGYWNRVTGLLGLSPATPEEAYWNHFSPLFISSSCEFMDAGKEEKTWFIDGSSLFGIDQLAGERYIHGSKYALEHYRELTAHLKPGENIKFVSHSEGCAFAAGMVAFLISYDFKVSKALYLSPREGNGFISPHGTFAIQVHFINDPVCSPKRISGVDVYIGLTKLEDKKAGLLYAHGGTVRASSIRKVEKVLSMLPHDVENLLIEGHWTVMETEKGFDFQREYNLLA